MIDQDHPKIGQKYGLDDRGGHVVHTIRNQLLSYNSCSLSLAYSCSSNEICELRG